jgi:hypothetical protein
MYISELQQYFVLVRRPYALPLRSYLYVQCMFADSTTSMQQYNLSLQLSQTVVAAFTVTAFAVL